ncbi:MAG: D-glycerate dehydrogenase [Phycisphaerales bacterium]|nr:MAG: D-glycerate dehydrogenase [Phycisphaerales bacterium]
MSREKSDQRIVITRPLPGHPVPKLRAKGFENIWINSVDERLSRDDLLTAVRGAHAVIATPADTEINAEFFDAAGDQLKIVSNYAVGVDNVDLEEAGRRNVIIAHTPHAVTEPTADIAWLLILAAARRAQEGQSLVRSGRWKGVGPNELLGQRLIGKTLFIVGAGRIGYATAKRSLGWDMNILYHARTQHEEFEQPPLNAKRVGLDDGLREADVVSIHTPLTKETRYLIGAKELALMKPNAILVNTARGPVVEERSLVQALQRKKIFAAGLDVFENEPRLADGLVELQNTFLLPHLGSATVEDREWMTELAVENAAAALRGEEPPHVYSVS